MLFSSTRFATASLILLCTSAISVFAQTTAPTDTTAFSGNTLSLREAITATLAHNPQLTSFQFRQQAMAGERQTAGLRPLLRLSTDVENAAGTGDYTGTNNAELTLALSSVIELGNKRDARLDLVTERQQELAVKQRIVELDLLAEVTRRFIETVAAQEHLALQQATLALTKDTTTAIKRRVNAGNMPDAELARAQANEARMAIALRQAELNFDSTKIKLSALWAETEPSFTAVTADLANQGDSPSRKELLDGLANNPDVLLFASEARLRDAELRLALSQRKADVEWNAGIRRFQTTGDSAFVVGLSVPLFGGSRATGEIATAKANQRSVDNERDMALIKLRAQVFALHQERQAALFAVTSLRNDVIPQLKKAVSGTRAAFDRGRYGYLELSTSQHELLEAEAAWIDAAAKAHLLRAEIERLSGATTTAHASGQALDNQALNDQAAEVNHDTLR